MNIVFDLGMVLIQWDPRHLYRKVFYDPGIIKGCSASARRAASAGLIAAALNLAGKSAA
jgi:hypothetical protein